MKSVKKIFVQRKRGILINGKVWIQRHFSKNRLIFLRLVETHFINSQNIRWLEPLTLLLLFGILLILISLMLS